MVADNGSVGEDLERVFARDSITLHRAESGTGALVLAGNSLYDLVVLEDPLTDLTVDAVLTALQSLEWASAGAPGLVMTDPAKVETLATALEALPMRVLSKTAETVEIQQAIAELLGVSVRSSTRMMVNIEVGLESGTSLRCFQSQNVSESGLLLKGGRSLTIGTPLQLEFTLPDEPEPIRGTALVVRHTGRDEDAGVGLRFVELERGEVLRLRRFVDRTLAERPPSAETPETEAPVSV